MLISADHQSDNIPQANSAKSVYLLPMGTPSAVHKFTATEDEWRAFCKMGEVRAIASPLFSDRVNLAHAEGLLTPMLAGDREAVQRRASELLESLAARIHSEYPTTPIQHPMMGDDRPVEGVECGECDKAVQP
jgi:hypothetical protein